MDAILNEGRYDSLFQYYCRELSGKHMPEPIPWLLIKAMAAVGSGFDPTANTSVGRGLLAIPDSVSQEYKIHLNDMYRVEENIELGVLTLRKLLYRLTDITNLRDRYACALAAYVSSLEYVSKSLANAREADGLPGSYKLWRTGSRKGGRWQTWEHVREHLLPATPELPYEPSTIVTYVDAVMAVYQGYNNAG